MTTGRLKAQIVLCAIRNLRLAVHFRELRPAVPGEIEGGTIVDGGFSAALADRQDDERSKQI